MRVHPVGRPNPRSLVATLGLLAACGSYSPLGQATTEPETGTDETGETGASSTGDTPTTGATETPPACDGDGECDIDEDAQNCPDDCASPEQCGNFDLDPGETCDDGVHNGVYGFCNAECSGIIECGDGSINGEELCDDGDLNGDAYDPQKHCNSACDGFAPHCGDGLCDLDVEGSSNCPDDCSAACGNGVQEEGEECDDGDGAPADSADCDADCTRSMCADGHVNRAAGEACDDGNADESDECPMCQPAACGDGFVQAGVEPCDDGDQDNADACSNTCELPRTVFITSTTQNGDLVGLEGADLVCQTLAEGAMLTGTYLAWLSTADLGPAGRFDTTFTGAFKLVNGAVVVDGGWADLVDGALDLPISLSEKGVMVDENAWTNTDVAGLPASTDDCGGWDALSGTSIVGTATEVDGKWTNAASNQLCNTKLRLYCFEDLP